MQNIISKQLVQSLIDGSEGFKYLEMLPEFNTFENDNITRTFDVQLKYSSVNIVRRILSDKRIPLPNLYVKNDRLDMILLIYVLRFPVRYNYKKNGSYAKLKEVKDFYKHKLGKNCKIIDYPVNDWSFSSSNIDNLQFFKGESLCAFYLGALLFPAFQVENYTKESRQDSDKGNYYLGSHLISAEERHKAGCNLNSQENLATYNTNKTINMGYSMVPVVLDFVNGITGKSNYNNKNISRVTYNKWINVYKSMTEYISWIQEYYRTTYIGITSDNVKTFFPMAFNDEPELFLTEDEKLVLGKLIKLKVNNLPLVIGFFERLIEYTEFGLQNRNDANCQKLLNFISGGKMRDADYLKITILLNSMLRIYKHYVNFLKESMKYEGLKDSRNSTLLSNSFYEKISRLRISLLENVLYVESTNVIFRDDVENCTFEEFIAFVKNKLENQGIKIQFWINHECASIVLIDQYSCEFTSSNFPVFSIDYAKYVKEYEYCVWVQLLDLPFFSKAS